MRARKVGQHRRAIAREDRKRFDQVAFDLLHDGRGERAEIIEPARNQVLHCRPAAAVGDMREVDADRGIEQRAIDVSGGASPGRTELHGRMVLLRIGDELLQVRNRQILARDQHHRLLGNQHDGSKIGHKVVERILVERLIDGIGSAAEHELIAVRRRLRHPGRPHHSAGAADVLDHNLLAQDLGEARGKDPPEHIRAPTGRKADDHAHGTGRPALGNGRPAPHAAAKQRSGNANHDPMAHRHNRPHPLDIISRAGNRMRLCVAQDKNVGMEPHFTDARGGAPWL